MSGNGLKDSANGGRAAAEGLPEVPSQAVPPPTTGGASGGGLLFGTTVLVGGAAAGLLYLAKHDVERRHQMLSQAPDGIAPVLGMAFDLILGPVSSEQSAAIPVPEPETSPVIPSTTQEAPDTNTAKDAIASRIEKTADEIEAALKEVEADLRTQHAFQKATGSASRVELEQNDQRNLGLPAPTVPAGVEPSVGSEDEGTAAITPSTEASAPCVETDAKVPPSAHGEPTSQAAAPAGDSEVSVDSTTNPATQVDSSLPVNGNENGESNPPSETVPTDTSGSSSAADVDETNKDPTDFVYRLAEFVDKVEQPIVTGLFRISARDAVTVYEVSEKAKKQIALRDGAAEKPVDPAHSGVPQPLTKKESDSDDVSAASSEVGSEISASETTMSVQPTTNDPSPSPTVIVVSAPESDERIRRLEEIQAAVMALKSEVDSVKEYQATAHLQQELEAQRAKSVHFPRVPG